MAIEEILAWPQAITWLPWAVQYFFFIGIAACAALLACGLHWWPGKYHTGLEGISLFIALTCAITAPLALAADLHQPARVWHFYAWPTPWSWMPWGALFLPLFTLFLGAWFLLFHARLISGRAFPVTRWCALAAALTAIGLLLYTGREISVVRAHPLWFSYYFPLAMFLSALQTLLALLMAATGKTTAAAKILARVQLVTLTLLGLTILAWVAGDTLSAKAIYLWLKTSSAARGYAIALVLLWMAGVACALYATRRPLSFTLAATTALLGMGLSWLMRWTLLIQVQTIPKYNALVNPYSLSLSNDGVMAIIGTFGLWIALVITVRQALNWFTGRKQHG